MMTPKDKAIASLRRLSTEEQAEVFREVGVCTCAMLAKEAARHPEATIGAAIGALAGAVFKAAVKSEARRQAAEAQTDPKLLGSLLRGK